MAAEPTRSGPGATRSHRAATAPADTLPPELAGHPDYEIARRLGGGGMGVVYLVHNRLMGRDEVLKVISPQLIERPEALDRFQREIRAVARLRHPNIVSAYTAFRCGGGLVFAMEYVEGLDLARMVKASGPLPVANACAYARQAALGLQHAYEHGMVHRDIKPGNLMLTRDRDRDRALIKVLDFGLARAERENIGRDFGPVGPVRDRQASADPVLTATGDMLGTPDFVAPEQILDAPSADIRADIYSLGCTLYYLLSGGPPFPAATLGEVLRAHRSTEARPLDRVRPGAPAELAAVVARMMAKDPVQRFQTPGDAAQALAPFSKKGEGAPGAGGTGTHQLAPTPGDRLESRSAPATTQPGMDLGGSGARAAGEGAPSTLEARRGNMGRPRGATGPAGDDGPTRTLGRRPAWVWTSVAAGVLALGLGVAWAAGLLRSGAAERTRDGRLADAAGAASPPAHESRAPSPTGPKAPGGQDPSPIGARASDGQAPGKSGAGGAVASSGMAPTRPGIVPSPRGPTPVVPSDPDAGRVVPPGPAPDQILAAKGLRRSGQVYVLAESEAPIARLREVSAQMHQLEAQYHANRARYAAIEADYQRVESEIAALDQQEIALTTAAAPRSDPERAELEREEQRLMNESFDHIKDEHERDRKKRERDQALEAVRRRKNSLPPPQPVSPIAVDLGGLRFRRGQLQSQLGEMSRRGQELIGQNTAILQSYEALQAEGLVARDRILHRYSTLGVDPEVKSALRELNRGRGPGQGYFLGPADDLPSLVVALKRTALEILLSKGLDYKKGRLRFQHRAVSEVRRGKEGLDAALRRLGDGTSPLEKLREQEKRLRGELARATSSEQRTQLIARLNLLGSQIGRLVRPRGPEGAGTAPDPRGELVRAVVGLRRAVDTLQAWYTGLERDAEVRKALQEVGWGSKPIPAPPELALGLKELERAESRVEATPAPLRTDGGVHRVEAKLNGREVASLVVDPASETVLTARLASEAGVAVAAEEPIVVRTVDGRRVSARRANLRSVQVGRYTATDSPCLVLLDGGAGVVPRLGRGFLDRFGGTIDEATGTLVLGDVKPSPSARSSPPTKGGDVPPRPPVGGTGSDRTGQPSGRPRG